MKIRELLPTLLMMCGASSAFPQTATVTKPAPIAATAPTAVPALVPYSAVAEGTDGRPLTGDMSMTFLLFRDEAGGEPLWTETQTISVDANGVYKVQLGRSSPSGLPLDVFESGMARWLEVQIAGQKLQPRTLLTTVPYAAKAADAATLGGLPASAFALAGTTSNTTVKDTAGFSPDAGSTVTTTGGTTNYIPIFTGASTIANSEIYDTGTSVGVGGVPNASAKLDVKGSMIMRGNMIVSRSGNATASKGYPSYGFDFFSNVYNSSTNTTANPYFALESEPAGNNTSSPSATFNLRYSATGTEAETGFYVNPNGVVHFATGQTFPGGGGGTITGVTAGTALTGGGTSGAVTLNLDTTKVPLLGVSNNFTGTQTITNGIVNLSPTTGSEVGSVYIGGLPFLHGYGTKNVFVGNAGNFSTSGSFTAGVGYQALASQTSGSSNTAIGDVALYATTSGSSNTAVGNNALFFNSTGSNNTAIGVSSGPSLGSGDALTNTTAVGYGATVTQSNSLVLGQTNTVHPGTSFVNVGIGTAAPVSILEASQANNQGLGPSLTLSNYAGGTGAGAALDFLTYTPAGGNYNPASRIQAADNGNYSDNLLFYSNVPGGPDNGLRFNMEIAATGQVTIGNQFDTDNSEYHLLVSNTGVPTDSGLTAIYGASDAVSTGYGGNGVDGYGEDSNGGSSVYAGTGARFEGGEGFDGAATGDGMFAAPGESSSEDGYAGVFVGNVSISGTLNGATPEVKIDSPIDPANKYLVHAAVGSSEMLNIYSGNVTTDELGLATVNLPDWFSAYNTDFRYQLTVMGQFAQAIVKDKIADGKFRIMTNTPHVEVSWMVSAVRQDAYAKTHPVVVHQDKPASERGFYLHPELYGQAKEKQTEWGRHPEEVRRSRARRERLLAARSSGLQGPTTIADSTSSHALPAAKP
jgi:hypothetical protein